jgi:hypothetical protein
LVVLADALLAHDRKPLAVLCVKEAGDRDSDATRKAIKEAIERHASDGVKGQQDQLGQLMNSR